MGDNRYNVVIVGSGLGGLLTARMLGMEGLKVCVLEKNRQLGGNLQTFSRDKCVFDTGVHYIGGLDKGQTLNRIFSYAGIMGKLKLKRMDEAAFDVIVFDGDATEYPHGMGYDNFINNLSKLFPEERANIERYCAAVKNICDLFPMYSLSSAQKEGLINKYYEMSAKSFIEFFTDNHKLQQVLAGSNMLYAGDAYKTPAYMHALIVNSYIESAWRCVNGGSQIALALAKMIKQSGGVVRKHAEVKRFLFEGDIISGVELANGEALYADKFVSNIHPQKTQEMVGPGRVRKSYESRIASIPNGISFFSLHIVLKPESFEYLNRNYYWFSSEDSWHAIDYTPESWPESYMLSTPATTKPGKYADSISIMAYMRYEEVAEWADTFNTEAAEDDRSPAYQEFKLQKAEQLLDAVERRFPGLRDKVQAYYTSTPLSYRDYINTPQGAGYGVLRDYHDPLRSYLSPRTKIENLYQVGQNLNMHGILGVSIGAVITCTQIIDSEEFINKIGRIN